MRKKPLGYIGYPRTSDPRYDVWCGIRSRCLNEKSTNYPSYGGRGITMCVEWENSFEQFAVDMGIRPSTKHTVERVDNDAGYFPGNCIWATPDVQAMNKRSTAYVVIDGERMTRRAASKKYGVSEDTIGDRQRRGFPDKECIKKTILRPKATGRRNSRAIGARNSTFVERSGHRYGCYVLTGVSSKSNGNQTYWDAVCDCGNTKQIRTDHLKRYASSPRGCERSRARAGGVKSSLASPATHSEG